MAFQAQSRNERIASDGERLITTIPAELVAGPLRVRYFEATGEVYWTKKWCLSGGTESCTLMRLMFPFGHYGSVVNTPSRMQQVAKVETFAVGKPSQCGTPATSRSSATDACGARRGRFVGRGSNSFLSLPSQLSGKSLCKKDFGFRVLVHSIHTGPFFLTTR